MKTVEIEENDITIRVEPEACGCIGIAVKQYGHLKMWIWEPDLDDMIRALLRARRVLREESHESLERVLVDEDPGLSLGGLG